MVEELPAVEEDRPRCRIEFQEVCRGDAGGSCATVPKRVCVLATELVTKVSPAVSSLVVHKRLWSSNYVSNCIFIAFSRAEEVLH